MTKPLKTAAERLIEAQRLSKAVDAYRAQKPATELPQPAKPKSRTILQATPTPIPGFPFNATPPAEIPEYGTMARVQAIRQRRLGARPPLEPAGKPEVRKSADLRTWRASE
jgi:hypothetical protein